MSKTNIVCPPPDTHKEKSWEYQQYYLGEKDNENRKRGEGQHHWSGAKSLEWYTGNFYCDTMHGIGDYSWRHIGPENSNVTYEGQFYCNRMHGYGMMSYSDGRTFSGLFLNNTRWGPGVQSHANVREDVGLWRHGQLVRLAWRPPGPSIVPDFMSTITGRAVVDSQRIMLTSNVKTIGETNKALELLKQCGADPRVAVEKWRKVYSKYCTDLASPLCNNESFEQAYYKEKIYSLEEVDNIPEYNEEQFDKDILENVGTYYAWNNNNMIIDMMKHSYKHETQRHRVRLDVKAILSGARKQFKAAGNHEIDCRTLLMAACLDHVGDVAQLVNENNVDPNISDVQGNSAVMYATCGDQSDAIHFLVEAGANVDSFNDCCCTPLAIALLRYVCAYNDISPSGMVQALVPPPLVLASPTTKPMIFEWNIVRDQQVTTGGMLTKSPSKTTRNMSSKKIKSLLSINDQSTSRRKVDPAQVKPLEPMFDSDESISEDKRFYNMINREFSIKMADNFTFLNDPNPIHYIFDVIDLVKEIETCKEEQKRPPDKGLKKVASKTTKDTINASKEIMWQSNERDNTSIASAEKCKVNILSKIMNTILQLLSDGANPRLVRCPQPALLIAVMSNSPDLIRHLVRFGGDINEIYHEVFDYSPLDVAISRLLTFENLEMVRTLLECGADARHRLLYKTDIKDDGTTMQIPGPTLLHVVLAKKTENDTEEDIRCQLLELLLEYNCSSSMLYKGRSAIDIAMSKSMDILDIFIKNPKTDLNAVINEFNQSLLVKMFSIPFSKGITNSDQLQPFTSILLYGADPLIKCQNCEDIYDNLFVFAKKTLYEMESSQSKPVSRPPGKQELQAAAKKVEKPKKDEKLSNKSMGKMAADDVEDYRQAVNIVTDCARHIYIRWLQANLMEKLIITIDKYKHRHWNNILKDCQNIHTTGLWLTPQRCLEIWDIFTATRKKMYHDHRIIRHLINIVIYMSWQDFDRRNNVLPGTNITASIKEAIESDAHLLLRQHKADKKKSSRVQSQNLYYVKPELDKDAKKFHVCFECILPLNEAMIVCSWCKQISFCSYECMTSNNKRENCHPCRDYLKTKYFPSPDESIRQNV